MSKNKITWIASFALTILMLGCNAADDGFNAPDGSSVSFVTPPISRGGFGSALSGDSIAVVTLRTTIPIGVPGDSEIGNEIAGFIQCNACNLYVFKDDVTTYLPERSLVDLVSSGTMPFKTNEQGLFTFVVGLLPPLVMGCIDDEGNPEECETTVTASIGVNDGALTLTSVP